MKLKELLKEANHKYEQAESSVFVNIENIFKNNKKEIEETLGKKFSNVKELEDYITFDMQDEKEIYFLASLIK